MRFGKIDQLVNWELCLQAQLPLQLDSLVQCLHHRLSITHSSLPLLMNSSRSQDNWTPSLTSANHRKPSKCYLASTVTAHNILNNTYFKSNAVFSNQLNIVPVMCCEWPVLTAITDIMIKASKTWEPTVDRKLYKTDMLHQLHVVEMLLHGCWEAGATHCGNIPS